MNEKPIATVESTRIADLIRDLPPEVRTTYLIAHAAVSSGYFPDIKRLSQAVIRLVVGQRLGLTPLQALTGLYFVQGRLAMSASLMASRIKESGKYDYRVVVLNDEECVIKFFQRLSPGNWEEIGESRFSREDAVRAGLIKPGSAWEKYPRNMLFARALANGARWYCPDAILGALELSEAQSMAGEELVEIPSIPEWPPEESLGNLAKEEPDARDL